MNKINKFLKRNLFALLSIIAVLYTSLSVNATCLGSAYQEPTPPELEKYKRY